MYVNVEFKPENELRQTEVYRLPKSRLERFSALALNSLPKHDTHHREKSVSTK